MWNEILLLVAIDQLYFLLQSISSCIHRLHCKKDESTLTVISKNTTCLFINGHGYRYVTMFFIRGLMDVHGMDP